MEVGSSTPLNYSSNTSYEHDVFINFGGEETRNTMVGYLYKMLCNLGLITFMDEKILLIGDDLNVKLVKAIEESKFYIVVLSEHYASSKWCLRELVKIIECSGRITNRIFPVFYHVDPSHVRNQTGSFKQSFDLHQQTAHEFSGHQKEKFLKEIQNWRDCLTTVSNIVGEVVTKDSPEVEKITKIAKQIFVRCKVVSCEECSNLFETDVRLGEINKLLDLEMNNDDDVQFVGIVGMCGIGKTTLAEVVYDKILLEFLENSCFIRIDDKKDSVLFMQRKLLCTLLRENGIEIFDEKDGAELIKRRLSGRKVLIVLDGVKNKAQLEKLAGSPDWFGPKSRVIITTRNKAIFRQSNYGKKIKEYNVGLLTYESASSLFRKYALADNNEDENLKVLCNEIVKNIGGLPLALKKYASFLHGQGKEIWDEHLESLREARNTRLLNILKLCLDGLREESQQVFLDLACFFHGSAQDKVVRILESLDYEPLTEIQMLSDCFFIEVRQGKISIPSFIQTMGQQIERKATRRTRIWNREDLHTVFDEHRVEDIKGIVLDLNEMPDELELELEASEFTKMRYLRILEIGEVQLDGELTYLSKQLRFLNWRSYPSEYLPSNFESRYLCRLFLPDSQIKKLWTGQKRFMRLKMIDASNSRNLEETPDFNKVPKLEKLILRNCTRLHTIGSSITTLSHLIYLDLTCCVSLENYSSIYKCKNLQYTGRLQTSGSSLDGRSTSPAIWYS